MGQSHNTWNLPTGLRAHAMEIEVLQPDVQRRLLVEVQRGEQARRRLSASSLGPAEQRALEAQVRLGHRATRRLVSSNLRLVIWIARRAVRHQNVLEFDDLVQEGVTGLTRAIEKFDLERGTSLSTYATWWIRQSISRAIINAGLVRIPVHVQDGSSRTSASETCAARFRRMASLEAELDALRSHAADAVADGALELLEEDSDLLVAEHEDDLGDAIGARSVVAHVLSRLNAREVMVLECRAGMRGDPMTLEEIGQRLGVTRERVRQIEHRALERSRALLKEAA
jgi:RNA polymerase primary sigma factor